MKRSAAIAIAGVTGVTVVFAAAVQTTELKIQKGVLVGQIPVGGMTVPDGQKRLRIWWEEAKRKELTLTVKGKSLKATYTPSALGMKLDDVKSIAQVPTDGLVGQVIGDDQVQRFPVAYTFDPKGVQSLNTSVKQVLGEPAPAKVKFVSGNIVRIPEQPSYTVDVDEFMKLLPQSLIEDGAMEIPLKEAPKKITDEVIASITDVIATFSTNFSAGNRPRSSNIKLASEKIDGLLLLPGEKFSFNGVVGRRTVQSGFKEAGVFINGRHDTGVGGGICQVSTTLYNAALFSNLKIVSRTNHSLPVPYVPTGRDATVNYGAQDLVIENNNSTPIVISNTYTPGKLTFRILGKKEPGLEIKVITGPMKSWANGSRREFDPSLPPGKTKVVEGGSRGRSITTYRVVYKNGQKVATENLGRSYYTGSPTIIAYGPSASPATPKAPVNPPSNADNETPSVD